VFSKTCISHRQLLVAESKTRSSCPSRVERALALFLFPGRCVRATGQLARLSGPTSHLCLIFLISFLFLVQLKRKTVGGGAADMPIAHLSACLPFWPIAFLPPLSLSGVRGMSCSEGAVGVRAGHQAAFPGDYVGFLFPFGLSKRMSILTTLITDG